MLHIDKPISQSLNEFASLQDELCGNFGNNSQKANTTTSKPTDQQANYQQGKVQSSSTPIRFKKTKKTKCLQGTEQQLQLYLTRFHRLRLATQQTKSLQPTTMAWLFKLYKQHHNGLTHKSAKTPQNGSKKINLSFLYLLLPNILYFFFCFERPLDFRATLSFATKMYARTNSDSTNRKLERRDKGNQPVGEKRSAPTAEGRNHATSPFNREHLPDGCGFRRETNNEDRKTEQSNRKYERLDKRLKTLTPLYLYVNIQSLI